MFFGAIVDVLVLLGVLLLVRFVRLVRPNRPEGLVLTPAGLIHDPGDFDFGTCVSSGKLCEIGRSEVGEVRLDRVGHRQRLTLDCGMERIEVGACLGDREREWLAGVLLAWANSDPIPPARQEPHVVR